MNRHFTTLLALLAALAAAGCGGEEAPAPQLIPAERGDELIKLLEEADSQFADDDCDGLQQTLADIDENVNQIPDDQVDKKILKTLTGGTERLSELANRCQEPVTVAPTTAPTVAPTTAPTTAPPTTEETVTEEETTTEEQTTEETVTEEESGPPVTPPGQEGNENSNSGGGGGD